MNLKEEQLKEIEERANKAAEGPWAWSQFGEKVNCFQVDFYDSCMTNLK